jgi:hypothetical protein
MTQYTHTIGRMTTSATSLPAWRQAMTSTDKLYAIGDPPSVAVPRIVWPSAGANNVLYAGTDSNVAFMHFAYGSSVFNPEEGTYGAMIFGGTGEAVIQDQLTRFTLSDNAPTWDFYQQPVYATSLSEAIAMNADAYYSIADAAAIPSIDRVPYGNEFTFASTWNDVYPVAYSDWVIRRKLQTSWTGNSRPHMFRYGMPHYIPSSMTGTGTGAIIVHNRCWHGPFNGSAAPTNVVPSRWYDSANVWPISGRQKHFLYAKDTSTKAWQRLSTPIPDFTGYADDVAQPYACRRSGKQADLLHDVPRRRVGSVLRRLHQRPCRNDHQRPDHHH